MKKLRMLMALISLMALESVSQGALLPADNMTLEEAVGLEDPLSIWSSELGYCTESGECVIGESSCFGTLGDSHDGYGSVSTRGERASLHVRGQGSGTITFWWKAVGSAYGMFGTEDYPDAMLNMMLVNPNVYPREYKFIKGDDQWHQAQVDIRVFAEAYWNARWELFAEDEAAKVLIDEVRWMPAPESILVRFLSHDDVIWDERTYSPGNQFGIREPGCGQEMKPMVTEPVRSGYSFCGWYRDPKFEQLLDWSDYVPLSGTTIYARWKRESGVVCLVAPYPLEAKAGTTVRFWFARVDGSEGSIAVKVKTQTSTALIGTGPENGDLLYVKEVLEWADGDTSDKYIDVPIYTTGVGKQFRFKLATMATGAYEGNLVPQLEQTKIYVPIVGATPGMIALAPTLFSLTAFENTTCRVWFSRIGGSDGSIAVKVKSQTSTATLRSDPTPWGQVGYVKQILEWGPGDTSDRYIDVPIYSNGAGLMFRLKLATMATGVYLGNLVPKLEEAKIYVPIVR